MNLKKNNNNIQEEPLITVIMPVYNSCKWIKSSIDSILNQTFKDFTLLVINDGSTDNSEHIILSYNDTRIKYLKNANNIGLTQSLNKAVKLTTTKYIARMDADDIAHPERLMLQFEFMEKNPKIGVCGSKYEIFGNEAGLPRLYTDDTKIKCALLFSNVICHPSVVIRKSIIENIEQPFGVPFTYKDNYGHKILELEDYALWHKLKFVTQFCNLNKVLLKYRKEGQNISVDKIELIHERKKEFFLFYFKELNLIPEDSVLDILIAPRIKIKKYDSEIVTSYFVFLDKINTQNQKMKIYPVETMNQLLMEKKDHFFFICAEAGMKYVRSYQKAKGNLNLSQRIFLLKKYFKKIN